MEDQPIFITCPNNGAIIPVIKDDIIGATLACGSAQVFLIVGQL